MKKLLVTLTLALPALAVSYGQVLPCGTTQATQEILAKHPELYHIQMELDAIANSQEQEYEGGTRASKVIPVVVHIIHNYGAENISNAQVYDAIRILNEDFQGLQPDTANIAAAFKAIQGNPSFEFRLARKDPNGNCTSGITRTVNTHTFNANETAKSIVPVWPRNKYMNIWVVQTLENGAGGYTYTPGTAQGIPGLDGIILVNRQFGSIGTSLGGALARRTTSHETGHWFNLQHTWGSNNTPGVSCGNDNVADTPQTMGVSGQNCNTSQVTCGTLDNVQNIMDYSSCPIMFTQGQAARMTNAANSATASRSSLWTGSNLTATGTSDGFADTVCAPIADFNSTVKITCVGSSLNFTDLSYNGVPASWAWTFTNTTDGITVANSASQNPSVVFTVPGTYTVALTVANAQGSNTRTKVGYVKVYPAVAQYGQDGFLEDFEGNIAANGWFWVNDNNSIGWQSTTSASVSGTKSIMVRNFLGEGTETYNLFSPSFNLSAINSPKLRFKYAYVDRVAANDDRLRVYASVNCGSSWVQLSPPITNTQLQTAAANNSSQFVPAANQWLEKEFVLSASVANQSNVIFRFEFDADGGNNFYLDDINIPGTASIDDVNLTGIGWDVYPNPADDYVDIRITNENGLNVSDNILICDASGRVVQTVAINGGISTLRADISTLAAGVYFIKSEKGFFAGTKKIIVR